MSIGNYEFAPWQIALFSIVVVPVSLRLLWSVMSRSNEKEKERRQAASEFRDAVLKATSPYYNSKKKFPSHIGEILKERYEPLKRACESFIPYLSSSDREGFKRAWLMYRSTEGREIDEQYYGGYYPSEPWQEANERFDRNVSTLLEYAKTK